MCLFQNPTYTRMLYQYHSLTMWLCQGDEVAFTGSRYERASKASHREKK